jgi:hypothetical protein
MGRKANCWAASLRGQRFPRASGCAESRGLLGRGFGSGCAAAGGRVRGVRLSPASRRTGSTIWGGPWASSGTKFTMRLRVHAALQPKRTGQRHAASGTGIWHCDSVPLDSRMCGSCSFRCADCGSRSTRSENCGSRSTRWVPLWISFHWLAGVVDFVPPDASPRGGDHLGGLAGGPGRRLGSRPVCMRRQRPPPPTRPSAAASPRRARTRIHWSARWPSSPTRGQHVPVPGAVLRSRARPTQCEPELFHAPWPRAGAFSHPPGQPIHKPAGHSVTGPTPAGRTAKNLRLAPKEREKAPAHRPIKPTGCRNVCPMSATGMETEC